MQRTTANPTRQVAAMSRRTLIKGLAAGLAAGTLGDRSAPAALARSEAALPAPKYVQTNGIRMAFYDEGQAKKVPIVLCHGFPELAYSWRHQLPALADAGFYAIAPDQRGYGLTERPAAVDAYTIVHLCNDLVGLLDATGIKQAVFCGHDWGGIVVWMMPLLHPDRVAGVIGVNTPLMRRPPVPPIQLLRQIRGEDNYIVAFQQPEMADKTLAADVRKTFTLFMRRGGLFNAAAFAKLLPDAPERKFQLLKMLALPVESYTGEVFLTPAELNFFVDAYTKTGFTGGSTGIAISTAIGSSPRTSSTR